MQIQNIQNNSENTHFKGKIKFNTGNKNIVEKIISRTEDKILHDTFLKATQVEHYSFRYGNLLKDSNYFAYLNKLKEILGIDLTEIASKDSEKFYEFSHSNDLWVKQPFSRISINKDDNSTIEHEFEVLVSDDYKANVIRESRNRKNLSELYKMAEKAEQWASSEHEQSELSRELKMVQMRLELAEDNGKDRFNAAEINELTGSAKMYKSEIPVSDLIKQLLNIGIEKGEPLTAQEIKNFLTATALMNKNEQIKVVEFMKSLKENCFDKTDTRGNLVQEKADASKFINLKNLNFVYSITKCNKPEILAVIADKTGITDELETAPDLFVKIYEISNGNLDLIQDLARCYYLPETESILSKLMERNVDDLSKYTSKTYSTDYHSYSFTPPDMAYRRKIVLEALGLTGQVELIELDTYVAVPVYNGNFERGKRR